MSAFLKGIVVEKIKKKLSIVWESIMAGTQYLVKRVGYINKRAPRIEPCGTLEISTCLIFIFDTVFSTASQVKVWEENWHSSFFFYSVYNSCWNTNKVATNVWGVCKILWKVVFFYITALYKNKNCWVLYSSQSSSVLLNSRFVNALYVSLNISLGLGDSHCACGLLILIVLLPESR